MTIHTITEPRPNALTLVRECTLPLVALAVGAVYATLCCSSSFDVSGHAVGTDDAYISYRYAQNWVEGHGLVFNPGERAEGFSTPLYVLLMTIPFLLGLDVFAFSVVLNGVLSALTLIVMYGALRRQHGLAHARLGAFLYALSPSLWLWLSSGMETPLVVLLQLGVCLSVERVLRERTRAAELLLGALVVAMAVARVDGFVTGGIAASYLVLRGRPPLGAWLLCVTLGTLGASMLARLQYYGEIWPLTYYAKVTASPLVRLMAGLRQLGGLTARHGMLPYLAAAALTLVSLVRRAPSLRDLLGGCAFPGYFAALWLGYWLYVGGDHFEDRFLVALIPICMPLLLSLLKQAEGRHAEQLVLAIVLAVQLSPIVRDERYGKTLAPKYDFRIELGRYLKKEWPQRLLAATAVGKIPFFAGLVTIDMYGLCDPHIAHLAPVRFVPGHSKEDPDYVIARKPDLIAAPFDGDGLDLGPGLTAERYRAEGYRVRLVVNNLPGSKAPEPDILDVRGRSELEIRLLAHSGWRLAVLERVGDPRAELRDEP